MPFFKKLFIRIDGYGLDKLILGNIRWYFLKALTFLTKKNLYIFKIFDSKMYLDIFDIGLSKQLIKYRVREMDHKILLDKIARPNFNVLDIGANIGYYALIERSLIGDAGKLLLIEPSPENVKLLKKNLELNDISNAKVVEGAVSHANEKKNFHLSHESNLNTFHNYGSIKKHLSGEEIEVDTYTVPSLLSDTSFLDKLDLIRMDVEGHEVSVINGMLEQIESNQLSPTIIFETHISRYTEGNDMSHSLKRLFNAGYRVEYAASSWQEGTKLVNSLGYQPIQSVPTDGVRRSIYQNLKNEDAINLICNLGGLRTVVLSKHNFD